MPDFTQPGSDGALPADFKEWQLGVTYTVRPEILVPLIPGREYTSVVSVRRKVPKDQEFTAYGDLYHRATAIASRPDAWIKDHAWSNKEFGAYQFVFVILVMGRKAGGEKPPGEPPPTPEALTKPRLVTSPIEPKTIDETYTDFDQRDPDCAHPDIVLFSYGEYVPSAEGLDFAPYIERAEKMAQFHADLTGLGSIAIVRREWMRATHPDLAVIHVYFRFFAAISFQASVRCSPNSSSST